MTYDKLYNKALCTLCLTPSEVEDYRPACGMHIPEITGTIPNAIIIWLKTGERVVFIDRNRNHELKIAPRFFEDVEKGKKKFEFRKDDRDYRVGDTITLKEFSENKYTGREIKDLKINYILRDCPEYGLPEGFCIIGF